MLSLHGEATWTSCGRGPMPSPVLLAAGLAIAACVFAGVAGAQEEAPAAVPEAAVPEDKAASRLETVRWKLAKDLPVLGHRNWIVVVDSAYPAQSRTGVETMCIGGGQVEVVKAVLDAVDAAKHVRGIVYADRELWYVKEADAPGIDDYRKRLFPLLKNRELKAWLHDDLIARLDADAEKFRVLILKTDMTLPYTSVFVQLDCGYWDAEKEKRLRATIESAAKQKSQRN